MLIGPLASVCFGAQPKRSQALLRPWGSARSKMSVQKDCISLSQLRAASCSDLVHFFCFPYR